MSGSSDEAARRALIRERAAASVQTALVPYRGSYAPRPVVQVPVELPIYRAENGRLAVLQSEHVRVHGLAEGYFRAEQALAEVQRLLHDQLLALAKDPAGPIFQELERTGVQTEALLVTADGVVLNGNRRLAAMRDLLRRDSDRYASFAEAQVTVLPEEIPPSEIEAIEATLQMAPETKLAYGWLARRLTIRRHRDEVGLTVPEICRAYRLQGIGQIAAELAELELAEIYLADYLGAPREYGRLAEAEPYFVGLRKTLAVLAAEERPTWRLAGFAMIRHAAELRIQAERYFPFTSPNPPYGPALALVRFGNDEQLWPERDADLDVDPLSPEDHRALQRLLGDPSRSGSCARRLSSHLDQVLTEHRERQLTSPRELLKKAQHLNRQLAKLDPEALRDEQRRELLGALTETRFHAAQLAGSRRSQRLEGRITDLAGWIYYLRRKALLKSKR
ncbi:MAG: hypothetical protein JRI23_08860 [Deltaproteobacteria bacterium]|jgi:hypothetical protein|nr:hypothetical protein [Deltaproteobacteria bacterium]MBW2531741.1 hypothetical protein [Deltaproteobacteria bacterium]